MCFNPLRIKNPSYDPQNPLSHKYNYVPCGHCAACRDARVKELQARCDFEYGASDYCLFVTFTYSNEYLPVVSYLKDGDGLIHTCSTWNKQHITTFLKRVRIAMSRNGYGSFKYLITPERGSNDIYKDHRGRTRRATARPHYHAVFFVKGDIAHKREVMREIEKQWFYGRIKDIALPTPRGNVRSVGNCIKYVVKYAVKDVQETMFNLPQNAEIISHNQHISYADMCPKMRSSQFIGIDWLLHTLGCSWSDITRINERGMTFVDWKKVYCIINFHPSREYIANTFAHGECLLLDGRITSIPRYFFKNVANICFRVDLGFRVREHNNKHTLFNGYNYSKFDENFREFLLTHNSVYDENGYFTGYSYPWLDKLTSQERALFFTPVTSSCTSLTPFGRSVGYLSLFDKCQRFIAAVRELATRPLDSIPENAPSLGYLSTSLRNALPMAKDYALIEDYASLSDEDISDEYISFVHDEDLVSRDFLRLAAGVRVYNACKSSVARYSNDLKYKNNLAQVLEKYPEYFLPNYVEVPSLDDDLI